MNRPALPFISEAREELQGLKVLYVEDDVVSRSIFTRGIQRVVDELYVGSNGREGLELFRKYHTHVVITDIKMPVMDGIEMAREIRKEAPFVPIIIVSAFTSDYREDAIQDIGIYQFFTKPLNFKTLLTDLIQFRKG